MTIVTISHSSSSATRQTRSQAIARIADRTASGHSRLSSN